MKIAVSSPATVFLFGEYGTRYGTGGITTAVSLRTKSTVSLRNDSKIVVNAPFGNYQAKLHDGRVVGEGEPPRELELSLFTLEDFYEKFGFARGVDVEIAAEMWPGSGVGSSAAIISSLYGALLLAAGKPFDRGEIMKLAKPIQAIAHGGMTSGTELMTAVMGGLIEVDWDVPHPSDLKFANKLVIGYTKMPRNTSELVSVVEQKEGLDPFSFDELMFAIKTVVEKGKAAIAAGNDEELGKLLDENHSLLMELGVSSVGLEALVKAARGAGALGAKISGPGGGKCMVAFAPGRETEVAAAIELAGGKAYIVDGCAEGVRKEK